MKSILKKNISFSYRDGLSSKISTPSASYSCRSDPSAPLSQPELLQPRVYYMARTANAPRQQKIIQQQRTKLSSASGRSGSGSRQHHHRSSPKSSSSSGNHQHYYNPVQYHHQHRQPPEARSLTTDTSFHSESFYPDWAAHPHHIRLPYPSPESSFDQLWFASAARNRSIDCRIEIEIPTAAFRSAFEYICTVESGLDTIKAYTLWTLKRIPNTLYSSLLPLFLRTPSSRFIINLSQNQFFCFCFYYFGICINFLCVYYIIFTKWTQRFWQWRDRTEIKENKLFFFF